MQKTKSRHREWSRPKPKNWNQCKVVRLVKRSKRFQGDQLVRRNGGLREEKLAKISLKKIKNFTSYRFCKSEGSSNVDRVKGGAVRASGENAPNELAINLFDGQNSTKWLDFGGGGQSGSAWVEYRLRDSAKEVVIVNYNVVSANDSPERDPCDWSLFTISSDSQGNEVQQEIDCQSGIHFQNRYELKSFNVTKKLPARRWQFVISRTREPQSANSVQISRLEYFCDQSSIKNDSKELSLEEIVKNEFNKLILQGKEPNEAAAEALAVAQQKLQT
eukprot:TRINITY_DN4355_c0_g2_i8.p2 TRINITY_DN4355_c0_g2~~TRINITY_DN4355_c0_g2_i8.p2  ORF type:complete len:275 (-),score=24.85 TRINITY_DN4355_c0_g2_i8:272-1096(-)